MSSSLLLGVVAAQSVAVLWCVAVHNESMPLLMSSQSLIAADCRLMSLSTWASAAERPHVICHVDRPRASAAVVPDLQNFCAFALAAFRTSCHSLLLTFPFHQLSLPRSFQPWCRFCSGSDNQRGRPAGLTGFASSHTFQSLVSEADSPFSMAR